MRRRILRIAAIALAIGTATAMTACGTDNSSNSDSSNTAGARDTNEVSAATDSFPVSVDTSFGEVTIKEQPKRVIALGWGDAEIATELGVQPIGVSDWLNFGGDGLSPWAKTAYDSAPEQLGTMTIAYEKIAALHPDLILNVRAAGDDDTYKKLSALAPTISIPQGGNNWLTPWDTQVEMISTALGEKAKGTEMVTQVNNRLAKTREEHPEWSTMTATVLAKTANEWGAYVSGDARADLVRSLGFAPNTKVESQAKNTFYVSLSEENVNQADSDVIVGFPIGVSANELADDIAWKNLSAVKNHRVVITDQELANAISLGTPAAILHALDLLVPLLEKATA